MHTCFVPLGWVVTANYLQNTGTWWTVDSQNVNSLWPNDIIWWHRFVSTLAQVMACCLMAPSHCLNQYWFIIISVLCHSHQGNSAGNTHESNHYNTFEILTHCSLVIPYCNIDLRLNWLGNCLLPASNKPLPEPFIIRGSCTIHL